MILVVYLVLAAFYAALDAAACFFNYETTGMFFNEQTWRPLWFGGFVRLAIVSAVALAVSFDSYQLVATACLVAWHAITTAKALALRAWILGVGIAASFIACGAAILAFNWTEFIQQATALFAV